MAVVENQDLSVYCTDTARRAKRAAARLVSTHGHQRNGWLRGSAELLRQRTARLIEVNQQDLQAAPGFGLTPAQTDRLRLTVQRIEAIATGMTHIALLPDPLGEVISSSVRPNGLEVNKVRVPLGVVFFIYESRPNVTADAAAICLKSGNSVILRGGKEAAHSSRAIVEILQEAAVEHDIPADAVQLVSTSDRAAVGHFLALDELIDVAIPRGGSGLIQRVSDEARMPVIKHFAGNCHVYLDAHADLTLARDITVNSKCQRLGVCNTCESLLVHASVAEDYLPPISDALRAEGVELRGDERTCDILPDALEATEDDFYKEYLAPVISIRVVSSLDEAIEHINQYGSHHTDAIVTSNLEAARQFTAAVDSAAVMVNASTRFNDGAEFGLGAEIGISTDKFHARGPCGLKELTSYKYVVYGNGQLKK